MNTQAWLGASAVYMYEMWESKDVFELAPLSDSQVLILY